MSSNRESIIEYMKEHYPNTYQCFSDDGRLTHLEAFKKIDSVIKESKKNHMGIDMSGMQSLLSTIKLERIVLGEIDINTVKLFPYQWDKVYDMLENEIIRGTHQENFYKGATFG